MKTTLLRALALSGGLFLASGLSAPGQAAPAAASAAPKPAATSASSGSAPTSPMADLQALVTKIMTKIQAGQRTEAALAPELQGFDDILAAHKGAKADELAEIYVAKGSLYLEVLQAPDKALAIFQQLVNDFPDSSQAKQVTAALPQLEAQIKAQASSLAIQRDLVAGKPFPAFPDGTKDVAGKPLAIANYKGKILLVDFWATWCGPCVAEMPNVIAAYNKYHDKGFEIIGVSLDDDAANGKAALLDFTQKNKMPWVQFYDGKHWQTELAVKYGIESIPASYLLDGNGNIIAVSPRGPELAPAIEKALAALAPAPAAQPAPKAAN